MKNSLKGKVYTKVNKIYDFLCYNITKKYAIPLLTHITLIIETFII